MAWSILLYGCETWTLKKDEIKQMEACEMWFWRRLLKIKSTDKISNEEVLRRVDEQRTLIDTIYRRKRKWIGHAVWGDGLMKLIMEGRMEGSFPPGKPRIGMLDMVKPKFMKKQEKRICYYEKGCNGSRGVERVGAFKPAIGQKIDDEYLK